MKLARKFRYIIALFLRKLRSIGFMLHQNSIILSNILADIGVKKNNKQIYIYRVPLIDFSHHELLRSNKFWKTMVHERTKFEIMLDPLDKY